ncbi:S-methyl-5'-thioinosine phosphorylase [hydrothermal vent metagenome]|uniref:S-methyl-5'-thioinosine phosphorylase n=1 Tax=hydrothermal vent metagenome TaxID=652676 RepID=A0A3B0WYV3_9ZZZZ
MLNERPENIETAIVGGSGLYQLDEFEEVDRYSLITQWGKPSSDIMVMNTGAGHVAFLTRHGAQHNIPPHNVNYRANLWALKECGVKRIFAVAVVGGITEQMSPETLLIPNQIIDYTYGRKHTFFDSGEDAVSHIDFTEPYAPSLRAQLLASAEKQSINVIDGGVYAATQGPRLETAAEIQKLLRDGADIVGMTGMPEASLARELGIDYACCALVVNWAAGCAGTTKIDHDAMQNVIEKGMVQVKAILKNCININN